MRAYTMPAWARWVLLIIAVALGSVTALSVSTAVGALIADPLLSRVYAGAAVLLDAYKYLAWPIALGLSGAGRKGYAFLMIATALVLGAVSAWATYDRALTAVLTDQARKVAIVEQRIADLQTVRADALTRLATLDEEARSIGEQARQLRERDIVTKAQLLENAALPRIAAQREQALLRLDRVSLELTELRSQPQAAAGLTELLAMVLCGFFALALEVVPALIGAVLRLSAPLATASATPVAQVPATPVTRPATADAAPMATAATPVAVESATDEALLQTIREMAQGAPPGTALTVRDVAASARVGTHRATKLLRAAVELGELRKTTSGYVTA